VRSYHIAAASLAIGCDAKWLDNAITQFSPAGVTRAQRGVARQISADAVLVIAVPRRISLDVGSPMGLALEIAASLVDSGGQVVRPGGTALAFDLDAMRQSIEARLGDASEVLVTPRRGRPRRGKRAGDPH